ncbi:MAG TPA: DUF3471 domain-containing protein, partial [Usitatibacter sp.]|nr:DUF3471 domain-containing protein [Usitatibacter sp.]
GLAWHSSPSSAGSRIATHNGGTAGFHAMIAVDREHGRAAVALVDAASVFDDLPMHLVDAKFPLRRKRAAVALDSAVLDEYVGRYQVTPAFFITFFRKGAALMTQATGQAAVEVFAEAKDRLFLRAADAQLEFHRDTGGGVKGFTLRQNGRQVEAARVPQP